MRHNFKKKFGQNFLKTDRYAHKIMEYAAIEDSDLVLEIGPGDGSLTKLVLEKGANITCVEIDYDLIPKLISKFNDYSNFDLVNEDILKFDLNKFFENKSVKKAKVIGSLPYNISKDIINKFLRFNLSSNCKFELMIFIVQEEVAKDYVAKAPESSILSIDTSFAFDIKKYESIPASQFVPKPKVNGGIIKLTFKNNSLDLNTYIDFNKFVRIGFSSHRRKLSKNLSFLIKDKAQLLPIFEKLKIDDNMRPAELDFDTWVKLFNEIKGLI